MAKILTIDFETQDPYIDRGMGSGWVYKVKVPGSDFEVLGAAVRTHNGELSYETDYDKIRSIVASHDILVMHNAQYDLGCLHAIGCDPSSHTVYDTEVMSRLYDSSLMSHALDGLAKRYLKYGKKNNELTDAVYRHDLLPWLKKEIKAKEKAEKEGEVYVRPRPAEPKLVKFAKNNMKLIQETDLQAMADYAIGDITPTYALFRFFQNKIDMKLAKKLSGLAHVCIDYRLRGVRIDMEAAREARSKLIPVIADKYKAVYEIAGEEFNISSNKEVPAVFDKLGIKYWLTPKTGNPSITTPWMEKQKHPLCKAIIEARKVLKIDRDFIQKIIDMQEFSCPEAYEGGPYGRVYPELHLLRARTGRFSCSCPNVQQIPSKDLVYGPICRSIFVPEEGERWYSLDYSNQEGRLQVHYAYMLGCEGAAELKLGFERNPKYDMHQVVADMVGVDRKTAKVINLGLSYGMGLSTLAGSLGVSEAQAKIVKQKYNDNAPFLSQLNKKCMESMKKKGNIKTLGGRLSTMDAPAFIEGEKKTFEYKALNKLIQGSAADQTIEAMVMAHEEGIPVLFPVHDQVCISGTREQAIRMQEIMEHCIELSIPTVVDVDLDGGDNWDSAGH